MVQLGEGELGGVLHLNRIKLVDVCCSVLQCVLQCVLRFVLQCVLRFVLQYVVQLEEGELGGGVLQLNRIKPAAVCCSVCCGVCCGE